MAPHTWDTGDGVGRALPSLGPSRSGSLALAQVQHTIELWAYRNSCASSPQIAFDRFNVRIGMTIGLPARTLRTAVSTPYSAG